MRRVILLALLGTVLLVGNVAVGKITGGEDAIDDEAPVYRILVI